jgi:hypothetical protein
MMYVKPQVGDKVFYQPDHYREEDKFENGIVKEVRGDIHDAVWVVYNCGGQWEHYFKYTSAKTNLRDLNFGWR